MMTVAESPSPLNWRKVESELADEPFSAAFALCIRNEIADDQPLEPF